MAERGCSNIAPKRGDLCFRQARTCAFVRLGGRTGGLSPRSFATSSNAANSCARFRQATYATPNGLAAAVAALTPYGLAAMAVVLAFGAYAFRTRRFDTSGID
jgi:hypothetical protein